MATHLAFQGLAENEIGCARISIVAQEHKRSVHGPDTEAQDRSPPGGYVHVKITRK